MRFERRPGSGWIVLIGGGEFSFGETEQVDAAWLARLGEGPVGFVPTASGSPDYGRHFADYLSQIHGREAETIPIYRGRDTRRGKNLERLRSATGVYLGGGVPDRLLEAFGETPCGEALGESLDAGHSVIAISGAAQALGQTARSLFGGSDMAGLGWLPGGFVEPNFNPAHDRRLRQALERPEIRWGLGIPLGSSVALGPSEEVEVVGTVFVLTDAEGDLEVLQGEPDTGRETQA